MLPLVGLAFVHDIGLPHRHVKPDTLLLDDHERALLSDFGVAEDTVRGLLAVPAIYVRLAQPPRKALVRPPAEEPHSRPPRESDEWSYAGR
jgi:serine/threonine protein kinase